MSSTTVKYPEQAAKLKEIRAALRLTREEMGSALGRSPRTMRATEMGYQKASDKLMLRAERLLESAQPYPPPDAGSGSNVMDEDERYMSGQRAAEVCPDSKLSLIARLVSDPAIIRAVESVAAAGIKKETAWEMILRAKIKEQS